MCSQSYMQEFNISRFPKVTAYLKKLAINYNASIIFYAGITFYLEWNKKKP